MRIIDMHCDTICSITTSETPKELYDYEGQISIKKLQKGGSLAQFFAIFIPTHRGETEPIPEAAYKFYKKALNVYKTEMEKNKEFILPAYNYDDIMRNKSENKMSGILTIEDGVPLNGDINRLIEAYNDGVRLVSFTWNYENSLGYPNSRDVDKMNLGLKPFGIEVIDKMNELGMIIDVSHLSDGGFYDVAKYSKKPFVASHSCCRNLCGHPRNLTDDMLKILGNKGGVVGINFCASFLNDNADYTDIDSVVRHMLYIKDKAGIDALGFGSDFDGIGSKLEFVDYTGMPLIINALEKHFTDDEIDKICNGNMLRVIKETLK